MVAIRKVKQGFRVRIKKRGRYDKETVGLVAAGLCLGVILVWAVNSMRGEDHLPPALRNSKPHPHLMSVMTGTGSDKSVTQQQQQPLPDSYNAVALDILNVLDCESLFTSMTDAANNNNNDMNDNIDRRRRLDDRGDDGGFADIKQKSNSGGDGGEGGEGEYGEGGEGGFHQNGMDDGWGGDNGDGNNGGDWGGDGNDWNYNELTAKHLFCAAAKQTPPSSITSVLKCDAADTKRQTLLDLWSAARSQMPEPLLLKVLGLAKEHTSQTLLDKEYNLWAPSNDDGLTYMLASLNDENSVDHGGLHGLHENLGAQKLFVDVGSCLGMTVLAVINLYPGTKIVSLEPASPNWLLQELNLRCNLEHADLMHVHVVLAGVGPNTDEEDNMMAKLMWRPTATTSTRAWTPSTETMGDDNVELVVRLRRLKSILAEADVYGVPMDVLNVDCEGCEYNLLPGLTEEEFDAIPTVMGGVHWGYIPTTKLPSSERGKTTHERLCQHENIARTAKECCAFPNLAVKSSVPGEILVREKDNTSITVADVAGVLCNDFEEWAAEHYLNDIPTDWGWMQLTSQA